MKIKAYRTTMPFDTQPGTNTSLSPTTEKSIMPFNNVVTIQDVLDGRKYRLPDAGGDWGKGDEEYTSYKEEGDDYKRVERDLKIFQDMSKNPDKSQEKWIVVTPTQVFNLFSLQAVQEQIKKLKALDQPVKFVSKVAQSLVNSIYESINSCVMVESLNFENRTKETGSAFCIAPNLFLTCAHVVKKYDKRKSKNIEYSNANIRLVQNGSFYNAKVVNIDWYLDLALISSDLNVDVLSIGDQKPIGEEIIVIGSPHGFENNITHGIISSDNRKVYNYEGAPKYFFVDADIFEGNSGGPVISANDNKVIGVVTLIISSRNSGYGLNACLQTKYIKDFLNKRR